MTTAPSPVRYPVRYPDALGIASCFWALVGWTLALYAPAMAFWPAVELLHVALPCVTGLLILGNLYYAFRALAAGEKEDRLLLVTALQICLFTTLFHQLSAHLGAEHFYLTGPTNSVQWIQFSVVQAIKAADIFDTFEAYGWNLQVIRHRGPLASVVLAAYHGVVDILALGVLWQILASVRRRLYNSGESQAIRSVLLWSLLLSVVVWLASALLVRPWRAVDLPLWLVENVLRILDVFDLMECFHLRLHGVPKEPWECTLTLLCRVWIVLGVVFLKKPRPARESDVRAALVPPVAILGCLFAFYLGMAAATGPTRARQLAVLLDAAAQLEPEAVRPTLRALRRLGVHGEAAVEPLSAHLAAPDTGSRMRVLETLGYLGPKALDCLTDAAVGGDQALAEGAVRGFEQIGPPAAPAALHAWRRSPHTAVRELAEETIRRIGADAVPYLIAALRPHNSGEIVPWFDQLDRNWPLRRSSNETYQALLRWRQAIRNGHLSPPLARQVGTAVVPELLASLASPDAGRRRAAVEALGEVAEPTAAAPLFRALTDADSMVRASAKESLRQLGAHALAVGVERLTDENPLVRQVANELLERAEPTALPLLLAKVTGGRGAAAREAARRLAVRAGADAVPHLVPSLAADDEGVSGAAAAILAELGPLSATAVPALADKATLGHPTARLAAVVALGRIGDRAGLSAVAVAVTDPVPSIQAAASESLDLLDPELGRSALAAEGIPGLLDRLVAADAAARGEAARWADRLGDGWQQSNAARAAAPKLVGLLGDSDRRPAAAAALARLGPAAAAALLSGLPDGNDDAREAAVTLLGQLKPLDERTCRAMCGRLADSNPAVRRAAARALREIDPAVAAAVPELEKALDDFEKETQPAPKAPKATPDERDPDRRDVTPAELPSAKPLRQLKADSWRAREEAARALGKIRPPEAGTVPALVAALADPDPNVRAAVADALGQLGHHALDSLAALARLEKDESNETVLLAVRRAIKQLGK